MKWNSTTINEAVKEGLKEFSKCKRHSKKWNQLNEQLKFVIKKQKEEKDNEKSN